MLCSHQMWIKSVVQVHWNKPNVKTRVDTRSSSSWVMQIMQIRWHKLGELYVPYIEGICNAFIVLLVSFAYSREIFWSLRNSSGYNNKSAQRSSSAIRLNRPVKVYSSENNGKIDCTIFLTQTLWHCLFIYRNTNKISSLRGQRAWGSGYQVSYETLGSLLIPADGCTKPPRVVTGIENRNSLCAGGFVCFSRF